MPREEETTVRVTERQILSVRVSSKGSHGERFWRAVGFWRAWSALHASQKATKGIQFLLLRNLIRLRRGRAWSLNTNWRFNLASLVLGSLPLHAGKSSRPGSPVSDSERKCRELPNEEALLSAQEAPRLPSLRESSQHWWLMVLLVAGIIACYAHRGTLSVAAPFMTKELNLSTAVMGFLLSAFFCSYSFMQLPAGWMVDRYGVKRSYALGYALWSLAAALTGFAHNLTTLLLLRMSLGIGQAVAFPASARAVAQWFHDKERGTVTATYLTGVRFGQALIAVVGAFFLTRFGLIFYRH